MNSLHRWQAKDKITDGTLVDNEDGIHRAEVNDIIWMWSRLFVRPAFFQTNAESLLRRPPVLLVCLWSGNHFQP